MSIMQATQDLVLVKVYHLNKVGNGLIDLAPTPANQSNISDFYGEVISIGPDCKLEINPGDKIAFRRNEGYPITTEKRERLVAIRSKWVEGIYEH